MSKPMKLILALFGLAAVAAVALTMLGRLDLPLGPLNGMLASDDELAADGGVTDLGIQGGGEVLCDPVTGLPIDSGVDPNAMGDPNAGIDPNTGLPLDGSADPGADPNAAIDPNTGLPIDPAADPNAPVAAGSDGWDGSSRVVADGAGSYDAGRVPDSWVSAAEAVDPNTGLPVDPATDPAAMADPTGVEDPLADPSLTDPALGGATGEGVPCDQVQGAAPGDGTGGDPSLGTDPGAGAGAGADAGAGAGAGAPAAGAAATRGTTDGTNSGNNAEALRAAKDATGVMQKANINVTTTATLLPATGGVGRAPALKKYRGTVTAASLVMRLDEAAMQQWTGAGKKVQTDLVKSFITRLGKSYRKAARSVTILDSSGTVLAVGDAGASGAVRVKLY